ncbi:MAG: lipoyl(octanoyl) transferase LipB [Alphaproteobacteria bacterium]|nr:lipoyl(octanoyl) transferase LipB [Alphaproteobacteria bacterium]
MHSSPPNGINVRHATQTRAYPLQSPRLNHPPALAGLKTATPVQWAVSSGYVGYEEAVSTMEARAAAIRAGDAPELVWLLEHPPLYTAGTGAKPGDLLAPDRFPVFKASRGGQYTYHGPGQRVAYVMLDLEQRGKDIRRFVFGLEEWIIETLAAFNVRGERREGRVGVWVDRTAPGGQLREDKIAAIGVRIRRWVSFHGISINVEPELSHFTGITPCGIDEAGLGVTSLVDLGLPATLDDMDAALKSAFEEIFSNVQDAAAPA